MTFLVEEVGERLAGTKSIEKAADYIQKELEKYGLDARIDRFPMYHSYPKSAALKSHLESLKELSEKIKQIELNSLIEKVDHLEKAVQTFNKNKEKALSHGIGAEKEAIALINEASIKVSRELSPILWMEAERYDQDPYGYYLVGKPIPRLYIPITQMGKLGGDQEEFNLWLTKFIREKNRVSDTIGNAIRHLKFTSKFLEKLK